MKLETLRASTLHRSRAVWLDEFLPARYQDIENAATEAFKSYWEGSDRQNLSFTLYYQIRDPTLKPVCYLAGSFNVTFFLRSQSDQNQMAHYITFRMPFPDRKYALECYQSEFATLKFLTFNTEIPVPVPFQVGYSEELSSPYILTSAAKGLRLDYVAPIWTRLDDDKQEYLRRQLASITAQLLQIEFPSIGAIHHSSVGYTQRSPVTQTMETFSSHDVCDFTKVMAPHETYQDEEGFYKKLLSLHDAVWDQQDDLVASAAENDGRIVLQSEYILRQKFKSAVADWSARMKATSPPVFCLHHPDFRAGRSFNFTANCQLKRAVKIFLGKLPTGSIFASNFQTG